MYQYLIVGIDCKNEYETREEKRREEKRREEIHRHNTHMDRLSDSHAFN